MTASQNARAGAVPRVAEDVLPGHPDRLADAVAERLVDAAVAIDPRALVGVEVAVFRGGVTVTGRIAAGGRRTPHAPLAAAIPEDACILEPYRAAGYRDAWALRPEGFAGPGAREPGRVGRILLDIEYGPLDDEESAIRGVSDDQNVVVGYALANEATGWLPPEAFAVRRLREALFRLREQHPQELGPDGKVLIRLLEQGGRFQWDVCNVAIQHAPGVGFERLHRLVLPALEGQLADLDAALPGLGATWSPDRVRLNGGGDFSCGGPHGDNGLSGKKLVVDHYGPGAPIGGGALCGKDPHKVDRAGALRARQLAVRLVRDSGAGEATVRLGFLPGLSEPAWLEAQVDGVWWDADRVASAIHVPDLSLNGTVRDLELTSVRWADVAARGYFGRGWAWER